jgi:hypothetical protein
MPEGVSSHEYGISMNNDRDMMIAKSAPCLMGFNKRKSIVEIEVETHQLRISDKNKNLLSNKGCPRGGTQIYFPTENQEYLSPCRSRSYILQSP